LDWLFVIPFKFIYTNLEGEGEGEGEKNHIKRKKMIE
jgi:hypothetical protein